MPDPTSDPSRDHYEPTLPLGDPDLDVTAHTDPDEVTGGDTLAYTEDDAFPTAHAPAQETQPTKDELFARRFVLEKVLGQGGMGRVYLARDTYVENRKVALKVLRARYSQNEEFRRLFFREIKSAQGFVSEHVNQVRDTGQDEDGTLFLTMDLVEGSDLAELLKREKTLNVRHALDVTRQVLAGLESGHDAGFVHRDVKPSNVMLVDRVTKTEDNPFGSDVRLLDFGIAGLAAEIESGKVVGTPTYMSPEQVKGERLDARSDLFAVGVMLYEMIAGTRPFGGKTIAAITESILATDVEPLISDLTNLSRPLQRLLTRALAKDRDKRFQSAREFITAIEKSKAYKLPKVMPAWAGALLFLLSAGAATEAYFLKEVMASRSRLDQSFRDQANELERLRGEKDVVIDRLELENRDLRAERQAEIDEKQGETDLQNKLENAQEAKVSLERDFKKVRAELGSLRSEHEALRAKYDDLDGQNKRLAQDYNTLQDRFDGLEAAQDARAVVAKRFDEVLMDQWTERRGREAQKSLSRLEDGAPVNGNLDGKEYLEALTDLVAGLESFHTDDASAEERAAAIDVIGTRLGRVEDGLPGFAVSASDWLWHDVDPDEHEEAPRIVALRGLLNEGGLLEEARAALVSQAQEVDSEWAEILAADPLSGPERVTVFAARFVDGLEKYVMPVLTRFADTLEERAIEEGRLDVDALTEATALPDWVERLQASPALARSTAGRKLLRLQHARRWYIEPGYIGPDLDRTLLPAEASASAGEEAEWQLMLGMMHDLLRPEAPFPVPQRGRLLYRITYKTDGRVIWRKVQLSSSGEDRGATRYGIVEQQFSADGSRGLGPETARTIERRGKVFTGVESGEQLMDLGGRDAVEVATRAMDVSSAPPSQLVSQSDWNQFEREVSGLTLPCLVADSDGTVRWISPRYGLLYQENEKMSIELAYGSYVR